MASRKEVQRRILDSLVRRLDSDHIGQHEPAACDTCYGVHLAARALADLDDAVCWTCDGRGCPSCDGTGHVGVTVEGGNE